MRLALLFALVACSHAAPPAKTLQLNAPGQMIDLDAALVADYVTLVEFRADWCGACEVVAGMIEPKVAAEPRIVVRKVDIGNAKGPLAHAYDVGALPRYHIYDRARRLRYVLVGNDCLKAADLARELAAE